MNGERWLRQLYSQIDTLEQFPERCPRALESEFLGEDLRQLIFKSHRVVFRVDKASSTVHVLHVRHAKRRAAGEPVQEDDEQ